MFVFQGGVKVEKTEMKKRLQGWGNAMERLGWKEEELKRLQMFYGAQKEIWSSGAKEKREAELEKIRREYNREADRIRREMVEILQQKADIDRRIYRLNMDEEQFLRLRFEKGYGFDYIGVKMHLSRASLFRIQDRVLRKMMQEED